MERGFEGGGERGEPFMREGEFYDLNPPSIVEGQIFHRVQCEGLYPDDPHRFIVRGIPQGKTESVLFVLRFVPNQGTHATIAKERSLIVETPPSRTPRTPKSSKPN